MDLLEAINWHPSLNDVIDDKFIDDERLERHSAMHRTLRGNFYDPHADIEYDFLHHVTADDIAHKNTEMKDNKKKNKLIKKENIEDVKIVDDKFRNYVPGIVKLDIQFPEKSALTQEQHIFCLKILDKISKNQTLDVKEQTFYYSLQETIKNENNKFLEMAKTNWNSKNIKIINEELINLKWKFKIDNINKLPRYYNEIATIPFISQNIISIKFENTAYKMENEKVFFKLPNLKKQFALLNNTTKLKKLYFTNLSSSNSLYNDENCKKIIESHDVDIVISTSGLKCLVNNLHQDHKNSWMLPAQVININNKNIVFIDKSLPPTSANVLEKNSWMFKYIVKSNLRVDEHEPLCFSYSNRPYTDIDAPEEIDEVKDEKIDKSKYQNNYSYNIYEIGACGLNKNELMKNKVEKDYKILVRTKSDDVKTDEGCIKDVTVVPKLEHQLALGAEAVGLEEISKQWASIVFKPDGKLVRVRINSTNSHIIQYEWQSILSLNKDMQRLYKITGEPALKIIYNVASEMTKMKPGKYLLRHTPRSGAFISVYREAESSGKNTLDIHSLFDEFCTIPQSLWPPIDTCLTTPALVSYQRMPAMFHPLKFANRNNQSPRKRGRPVGSTKMKKKLSN